jgi:HTH-type transcriptional regulator/antitoxin HigA
MLQKSASKKINMELTLIKTETQYEQYLEWVDQLFDQKVTPDSDLGQKLEVALLLIKQYEDANYPIPLPDPIEVIKMKMSELGLRNQDFVGKIGSKGYISQILNKRKPLTLELARFFHHELKIPAEVLLSKLEKSNADPIPQSYLKHTL